MASRRYAGYGLAALPTEDISEKLQEALAVLKANQTPLPEYVESDLVPGTRFKIGMEAHPYGILSSPSRGEGPIQGNPAEIQKIIDARPPGFLELGWGIDGVNDELPTDKEAYRMARYAQQNFKKILQDIPDGTIVHNAPVGGLSGDYKRADAYMHQGFGPLQKDGVQYGIMQGGMITPLSPFEVLPAHAVHLEQRARLGNQPELADAIQAEIVRRGITADKAERSPGLREEDLLPEIDDYGPDYDDDYQYPRQDLLPEQGIANLKRYIDHGREANLISQEPFRRTGDRHLHNNPRDRMSLPEINVRQLINDDASGYYDEFGPPSVALNLEPGSIEEDAFRLSNPNVVIPTPEDIQAFREYQVEMATSSNPMREYLDGLERVHPRPVPPRVTLQQGPQPNIDNDRARQYDASTIDRVVPEENYYRNYPEAGYHRNFPQGQNLYLAPSGVRRQYTEPHLAADNLTDPQDIRDRSRDLLRVEIADRALRQASSSSSGFLGPYVTDPDYIKMRRDQFGRGSEPSYIPAPIYGSEYYTPEAVQDLRDYQVLGAIADAQMTDGDRYDMDRMRTYPANREIQGRDPAMQYFRIPRGADAADRRAAEYVARVAFDNNPGRYAQDRAQERADYYGYDRDLPYQGPVPFVTQNQQIERLAREANITDTPRRRAQQIISMMPTPNDPREDMATIISGLEEFRPQRRVLPEYDDSEEIPF